MRTREHVIEDRLTLGDSGTKTIDIDVQDPISVLEVRLDASNGATKNIASPLPTVVDKIEVVDGSQVLYSMSGKMAVGSFAGTMGFVPNHYTTEVGADTPYCSFPLNFGRWFYDPQFALNPSAHRNPQLKITWNLANVTTVGANGYGTGSLQLSVNAKIMEQAPNPVGYLLTKEIDQFTSVASGDYKTEVPTDYPLRAMFVKAYESGVDIRNSITNLKLSANGDQFIPFNVASEDLIYEWLNQNKALKMASLAVVSNGSTSETWMGMSVGGSISARVTDLIVATDYFWKGNVNVFAVNGAGAAQSNVGAFIVDNGACLYNVIPIIFGDKMLLEDALQAQQLQNLRLFSTQGNAGADVIVATQQYRPY